ncbi:unnamed protein product [Brassica oleracea var. botrytis]|uniref:Uncharacterized protein n=1 Tax=Brassica oleracea TaxID=3712 RepID=A0A3P6EL32_BRAOL|nr:unnamed protein product [Brassica oleracea]
MLVICSADVAGHLRLIDGQQLQQCHILESFEGTMKGRFSVHLQLKRVSREPKQYCVCLFNRGDQGGDSYCRRDLGFPQAGNVSGKRLLMKLLDMVDLITSLSRRAWLGIPHGQGSILIIILCTLRRDNVQLRKGSNIHDEFNSSSRFQTQNQMLQFLDLDRHHGYLRNCLQDSTTLHPQVTGISLAVLRFLELIVCASMSNSGN